MYLTAPQLSVMQGSPQASYFSPQHPDTDVHYGLSN